MSAVPGNIRLAHVAVIVRNLEASARTFGRLLGLAPTGREVLPQEGVRLAFVRVGDARIELMEPRDLGSALGKFLAARGEGVHHLAFVVPDLKAALAHARAAGLRPIDDSPRPGACGARIAFLHPSGAHGVLIELVEE